MKQLSLLFFWGVISTGVRGEGALIDSFNSYSETPKIQEQQVKLGAWTAPSGAGVSDGLASISEGAEGKGRGAGLMVNWAGGAVARVRFVFAVPQVYAETVVFSCDLAARPALPDTKVYLTVRSLAGTEWRTPAQVLGGAKYAHFSFSFGRESSTRTVGSESLKEALGSAASILIQFPNPSGAGSQQILLDNLTVQAGAVRTSAGSH